MDKDLQWAIGLAVTWTTIFGGAAFGFVRSVATRFGEVHTRINDVRDKYVRRDDLDGHLRRIEKSIDDMREEQRVQMKSIMAALSNHKG